jgi:hypothetical protein
MRFLTFRLYRISSPSGANCKPISTNCAIGRDKLLPLKIAALSTIGDFIVEAGKQQSGWGRLRLIAMRGRGAFLRKIPRLRGRRKKVSDATDTFLPSLPELGVKDRRHASRDMKIADIPQHIFDRYLEEELYPTEKGLHRFATLKGDHEHGYLVTPDYLTEEITSEFGKLWDACPLRRHPDFDCLKEDWPEGVYLNASWTGNFLDYMKKAVEQIQRPRWTVLHSRTDSTEYKLSVRSAWG